MTTSLLEALRHALGSEGVIDGAALPEERCTDWSGHAPVRPLALLRPADTAQVAAALRLCHDHHTPVVPQGGRTGLSGGAVPVAHGVILSLERMQHIGTVDRAGGCVTVEAGATLQAVQEAAAAADTELGLDLGARGSCTIGGNIATNAGGLNVVRFGMARDQVLGLEVVLADGTVLDMLRATPKNNTGYDLKQVFIGAEGTLGVVTRAVLRLHPATRAQATLLAALDGPAAGLRLMRRLQAALPGQLCAFELMWPDFYATALAWTGVPAPFSEAPACLALAELRGGTQEALDQTLEQVLGEALEAGEATDMVLAQSRAQAAQLWRLREITGELPTRMDPINFDIGLPLARIGDFAQACDDAIRARWPAAHSVRFGHLGDGNLHLTVDARTLGIADRAEAHHAVEALVFALLKDHGGAVSAEHGIGLHKKEWLHVSRSPAELALMRSFKQALDPQQLMNPGKILDMPSPPAP